MSKEIKAYGLAVKAHRGQMYSSKPYISHVALVVSNLRKMGYDSQEHENYRIVGWLHDVVEDTNVTLDQIREEFGSIIADAVDAITRRKWWFGEKALKESEDEYFARVCGNEIARKVKWADMNANNLMNRSFDVPDNKKRLWRKYLNAMQVIATYEENN